MNHSQKIQKIADFVRQEMEGLCVAHDFLHIEKVVANARKIAHEEGVQDTTLIEIAAYLHEALDSKFFAEETIQGRRMYLKKLLSEVELSETEISDIFFTIENVGYSKSLERGKDFIGNQIFEIVEDADRLEAIGATAIARCFSYGAKIGRPLYDPQIKPFLITDKISYKNTTKQSTSLNHFFEKLLLLKDMMHTDTGRKLAEPKHDFMKLYVDTFLSEWNGEK